MFEVLHWASWRSNYSFKAFPTSSHTQILDIWSQNQNFPPGVLEDWILTEKKIFNILPYSQVKSYPDIRDTSRKPSGRPQTWLLNQFLEGKM